MNLKWDINNKQSWYIFLPLLSAVIVIASCGGGGGGSIPVPSSDTTPPTIPTNVTIIIASTNQIDFSWTASTDSVGVTGYKIYRDGEYLKSVTGTSTSDTGLSPATQYCYTVSAYDFEGNESGQSAQACATTSSPSNQPPVATFTGQTSALKGDLVTFDASTSTDVDGTIVSFSFNFGDGSPVVTQTDPIFTHIYITSGTFAVSLTVVDNQGASNLKTGEITIGLVISQPVNVSNTSTISQYENFSIDGQGTINVVWEEYRDDILFSRSADGGMTFSAPKYVVAPGDPFGSANDFSSSQMKVVSPDGTIHITWTIFDLFFGGAEVFYSRSTDGSATFSAPLKVSNDDGVNSYAPSIATDGIDSIGIVWADSNLNTGQSGIFYSLPVNNGNSFSAPALLADSGYCPNIAISSQNIYIAWTAGSFGQEEILFSRSVDGGKIFFPAIGIDHYSEKSWCPLISVDSAGNIYVVWEEGTAISRKILISRSADGGVSFSSPLILSTTTVDSFCPSLAVNDAGRVYVTWSIGGYFDKTLQSFLVFSSDRGATFSTSLKIPSMSGEVGCPKIIAGDLNQIGFGWHAPPMATAVSDIFYSSGQVSIP